MLFYTYLSSIKTRLAYYILTIAKIDKPLH